MGGGLAHATAHAEDRRRVGCEDGLGFFQVGALHPEHGLDLGDLPGVDGGLAEEPVGQVAPDLFFQEFLVALVDELEDRRRQPEAVGQELAHQLADEGADRSVVDGAVLGTALPDAVEQVVAADAQAEDAIAHLVAHEQLLQLTTLMGIEDLFGLQRGHEREAVTVGELAQVARQRLGSDLGQHEAVHLLDAAEGDAATEHMRVAHADEAHRMPDITEHAQRLLQVLEGGVELVLAHGIFGAEDDRTQEGILLAVGDGGQGLGVLRAGHVHGSPEMELPLHRTHRNAFGHGRSEVSASGTDQVTKILQHEGLLSQRT
ncbi:MAG: hypothetical protein BWY75_01097 [bacterium ADurb.Bin425]|nr:MAG: hypothetical protein BWY75_01097 [bacterium ADurb.Bin425]